jgi:hypothetical protein
VWGWRARTKLSRRNCGSIAGTVETRGMNLMRKLNLHTLAELIRFASSKQTIYLHSIPFIPDSKQFDFWADKGKRQNKRMML